MKEEKSALPLVENQTLHQLKTVADRLSGEEIEMIQEDNSIETAFVDQGTEEENQQMLENIEGEKMEINCCYDEDNMKELHCQEASETTDEEQRRITKLQFGEEQESPFHSVKENDLCKDERQETQESFLAFKTVEVIEKDEALDAIDAEQDISITDTMTQMTEVHGSLCTKSFGVINRNEKLEESHEDLGKGNTPIVMLAEEETKCHHDISLSIEANEETKGNETFEATEKDEHKGTVALICEEGQRKCLVGSLTPETADVMGEVEMPEAAEGRVNEFGLVEEEKGAQHDKEISGEGSEATAEKAQFPDNIASGSNQQLQIEEPETTLHVDHEDICVRDELTSEDSSFEKCCATVPNMPLTGVNIPEQLKPEIGIDIGFMEVQMSAEAAEARKENVASEPTTEDKAVESENPPIQSVERQHLNGHNRNQLEEVEDTFQVMHAANDAIEEDNLMMRLEEDNLDDEGDDDADEANIIEKMEKSSEGTGDSSESNTEPIWPVESLEEVSMELKELKINEQMEEDQKVKTRVPMHLKNIGNDGIIENSIQKGNDKKCNSELTFLERVMPEIAEQTHQPTYSQKLRILIPTLLVLSWSLCFWRFGLPILKISIIVILIKILSKIQGF